MTSRRVRHFGFGANLDPDTLERRGLRVLSAAPATVSGYKLCFDLIGVPPDEPCFATLRRAPEAVCAHGVLIEMSEDDFDALMLDEMTARRRPGRGYEVVAIAARTYAGRAVGALSFIGERSALVDGGVGSARYLEKMESGAEAFDLSPHWRDFLAECPRFEPSEAGSATARALRAVSGPAMAPASALRSLGEPGWYASLFVRRGLWARERLLDSAWTGRTHWPGASGWAALAERWPEYLGGSRLA